MFIRNCPQCNIEITHTTKYNRDRCDKNKMLCRSCGIEKMKKSKQGKPLTMLGEWYSRPKIKGPFLRTCPECFVEIKYSRKDHMDRANKLNSICNSCSTIIYKKSWTYVIKDEHIKKMAAKKAGYDTYEEYLQDLDSRKKYYREVRKITRQQDISILENYDKLRGLCGVNGAYQLDHIIPISVAYEKQMNPEDVGHISNLQIIPWKKNLSKSNKVLM
jgi:5-methylcytosine-specific restriction endonuclease McrA